MDPLSAGIMAGGSILGGLASGGGQSKMHPMEYIPEHLRPLYRDLSTQVGGLQMPEYFPGQTVADMNPWLANSLQGMAGWGTGMGGDMMNATYGAGMAGLGGIGAGMDYLNTMAGQGPNTFAFDQGTYDQVFGNLAPGMQGMFDSGALDIQRGFDWGTLPGLNMAGALGGQQGSTKQYQQGALGQALADKNIADFGLGLWTNAANQATQAGMTGGLQNLSSANNFMGDIISGYGNFGQLGGNLLNQGYNMGLGNMDIGLNAGQYQQAYDQSLIDSDVARWNFEQNAPAAFLRDQLSMIPGPGQPVQGTPGMSPWEGAFQGMQAGLGIYGMGQDMGWWGQPQQSYSNYMNSVVNGDYDWDNINWG